MELFHAGTLIRELRKQKKWTQSFLCDGICDKGTLCRIELNKQSPELFVYSSLMERLGEDPYRYYTGLITMEDKIIMDFDDKLTQLLRQKTNEANAEAESIIEELTKKDFSHSKKGTQLLLHHKATLAFNMKEYDKSHSFALEGIKVTKPEFESETADDGIYTAVEMELVNTVAAVSLTLNRLQQAKDLYLKLKKSLDKNYRSDANKKKLYLQIVFNLTNCLGALELHMECSELCDYGIKLSKIERNYYYLSFFTYNKAYALFHSNKTSESVHAMSKAYALFYGVDNNKSIENVEKFCKNKLKISMLKIFEQIAPPPPRHNVERGRERLQIRWFCRHLRQGRKRFGC